jgi:hypothetical protein
MHDNIKTKPELKIPTFFSREDLSPGIRCKIIKLKNSTEKIKLKIINCKNKGSSLFKGLRIY